MSGVLYDANGNVILSANAPAAPEQMVYDSIGHVINPAAEDGNLLDIENVLRDQLDSKLSTRSSETTLATINGKFIVTAGGLKTDGSAVTQPVSIQGGVNLPTGAATEVTLLALNTKVTAVDTGAVVVSSSALPAGAAISATQTDGTQKSRILDGAGNALSSTVGALDINIKSGTTVDVSVDQASDSVLAYGFDGALNKKIKTNVAGQVEAAVISSALPAGASTEATLSALNTKVPASPATEDGNLAFIKAKTDNLDTTLSTRASEATLGTLSAKFTSTVNGLKVDGSAITQPVSAASLPLPLGAATDAVLTGGTAKARTLDGSGNAITSTASALDVNIKSGTTVDVAIDQASDSVLAYGYDGLVNQKLRTNASGQLEVAVMSSALPTGAATNTTLTGGTQKTQIVDALGNVVTASVVNPVAPSLNVHVDNWAYVDHYLNPVNDGVKIYGSAAAAVHTSVAGDLQVNVLSSALPADAATQTTLVALNAKIPASPATEGGNLAAIAASVAAVNVNTAPVARETTLASVNGKLTTTLNGLKVDNSAVTQPISAAALPLPALASTSTKQSDGSQKTQIVDGLGNIVGSTGNAVDVNIKTSAIQIQTAVSQVDDSIVVFGSDGLANKIIKTNAAGQAEVVVTASALPTGAATEVTAAAINTKLPADPAREGGNLATVAINSAKLDVNLSTLASQTTLGAMNNKLTATSFGLAVDGSGVTQPMSAVSLPLPTGAATSGNQTTANTYLSNINNTCATELTMSTLNDKILGTLTGIKVHPGGNTFPISALALPLPNGAAADATLTNGLQVTKIQDGAGNALTSTAGALDVNVKSPIQVKVELSQADDSIVVYGSDGVNNHALATNTLGELSTNVLTSALPAGAATETTLALQKSEAVTTNTKLDTVNAKLNTIATNTTHIIASEPTAVRLTDGVAFYKATTPADTQPVSGTLGATQSGIWNINNVSGTIALPTGASTSSNQTTSNVSLSSIDSKMATLSQKNMASSMPVAIALDQTAVPISAVALPLPIGASTSFNQTTSNVSLSSIDSKMATLGQKNMASSMPVAIALDQTAVPISSIQLGEVQIAPTANTVLARLLDIKNQLTTQVHGLFDSAGNAISSALNFGTRRLPVRSLDIFSGVADEGFVFAAQAENVNLPTTGTYTPVILITNPAASGKKMLLVSTTITIATDNRSALFKFSSQPTFTAGTGTAITIVNMLIGSATASVASIRLAPTLTTNGTAFKEYNVFSRASMPDIDHAGRVIIPPGSSIAVCANPFINAILATVDVTWAEVAL